MNYYLIEGRWYQFAGRNCEKLGVLMNNGAEVDCGKRDQLLGRIQMRCSVSIEQADQLADFVLPRVSHRHADEFRPDRTQNKSHFLDAEFLEYQARRYEGRLRKGGPLVSVRYDASEEVKLAREILERTGAEDIASARDSSADYKTPTSKVGSREGETD